MGNDDIPKSSDYASHTDFIKAILSDAIGFPNDLDEDLVEEPTTRSPPSNSST